MDVFNINDNLIIGLTAWNGHKYKDNLLLQ